MTYDVGGIASGGRRATSQLMGDNMKRITRLMISMAVCGLLVAVTAARADEKKADPTGTWSWTVTGRDGTPRKVTAKLKVEDGKLSGTVSGRNGDTSIDDPKLNGDELSFSVTREFNGTKFVQKFSGKVSGDNIKGKIAFDRNGEPQSVDWNAGREAAKPAEPAAKTAEPAPKPAQP
jgi:hypothetical protein